MGVETAVFRGDSLGGVPPSPNETTYPEYTDNCKRFSEPFGYG